MPVQGANKAGKSAMRHIISDCCHGDFHLPSWLLTSVNETDELTGQMC